MIRAATKNDIEAIIEVETTSFPEIYTDTAKLAERRRRELEGGYPYHRVLLATENQATTDSHDHDHDHDQSTATIQGLVTLESYLAFSRKYHDSETGEGLTLPANRPLNQKPAYDILMAAARVDPSLLDDEFLFISEICVHPRERARGNGTRLVRHIVRMADALHVKIIVLVEGSLSDAARQWKAEETEAEDLDDDVAVALASLGQQQKQQQETTMPFYKDKLGFRKRAHFFWGRPGCVIPRMFHVMQYPAYP
ncbi:hypothetical protein GGR50DRAFT_697203 [Xylaria sp. CBS 124048]|nr:hypothetical protein GGR50DRAFT_697203 [Xylaria sp. CBS 124048]